MNRGASLAGIRTLAELEAVTTRSARRAATLDTVAGVVAAPAMLVLVGWLVGWWRPPAGLDVPVGVSLGAGVMSAVVLGIWSARVRRAYLRKVREIDAEDLEHTGLHEGDEFGRYVVLTAGPGVLHVTDRRSIAHMVAIRVGTLLGGAAIAAIGIGALLRYGWNLGPLSGGAVGMKLYLLMIACAWGSPVIGLMLAAIALSARPVQWIADREEGTLTLERLVWVSGRRLLVIPVGEIRRLSINDRTLAVNVGQASHELMTLAVIREADKKRGAAMNEHVSALLRARMERAARGVSESLGLRPDQAPTGSN
jgi:hypothetical protein